MVRRLSIGKNNHLTCDQPSNCWIITKYSQIIWASASADLLSIADSQDPDQPMKPCSLISIIAVYLIVIHSIQDTDLTDLTDLHCLHMIQTHISACSQIFLIFLSATEMLFLSMKGSFDMSDKAGAVFKWGNF